MLAVDANVLIRFLTGDDPRQAERALHLLRTEQIWIAKTVLLETEWVLRSLYGVEAQQAAPALRALVGLENVHVEDAPAVARALTWFAAGLDFADGLHLASLDGSEVFVTFDAGFRKREGRVTGVLVRSL